MSKESNLIFVYRADRGFYNTLSHTMHRVFSPASYECRLCQFTSSAFGMLQSWKAFIESRPEAKVFYHRKEFEAAHPEIKDELPLILLQQPGEARPHPLLDRSAIESCCDLSELIQKLESTLASRLSAEARVNTDKLASE
ncbi:hypothetical protein ACWPKO_12255 [Coraliomargarita sp. W4R53]